MTAREPMPLANQSGAMSNVVAPHDLGFLIRQYHSTRLTMHVRQLAERDRNET